MGEIFAFLALVAVLWCTLKKAKRWFFLYLFLLTTLLFASPFPATSSDDRPRPVTDELLRSLNLDREYHRCISVADGDTVTLEGIGTVRFIGVDTPEKNHPKLPVQYMSRESSAFIRKLCMNRKIRLEYDPYDEDKRGNYGRVLGYLYLEDGTFVQEQLLKHGYATVYARYPFDEKMGNRFLALEREARQKGVNLWKENGLAEVRWILRQKHAVILAERLSPTTWRARFGNWTSGPVHTGETGKKFEELYSAIYELGPRDLRKRLKELGYEQGPYHTTAPDTVSVMGMAHRKWGIIYMKYAYARTLTGDLDADLRNLSEWIERLDAGQLRDVLLKNGYHIIPEASVASFDPQKIADGLLSPYRIRTTSGSVMSWDLAGNHVGKTVAVEGKIVRTHNSGNACFLNFHNNFTRYLSLVIFENSFRKFPLKPEEFYLNKTVLVKGRIMEYKDGPEIVLESPRQIEIVESH
ncbi:MAG: thermonuclease family protein [Desulfobacterales bacterium]|nr:thermonuclease family protein [Desulfobacterales bacterium]